MISLVLRIIAFAGAMGIPAFLTAIVESAIRSSSWGSGASRRTNWTYRHRPAEIVIWTPFRAKDGPHYERREVLTSKEKKSNGKRPLQGSDQHAYDRDGLEGIAHWTESRA